MSTGCADLGAVGRRVLGCRREQTRGSCWGCHQGDGPRCCPVQPQQECTGTGSCPGSCPSSVHHMYPVAPAGCCIWLAACSVKAFGCVPEPNLYSYQIMKLTLWSILHHSVLTAIHYVPFLFFFIKHVETQISFSLILPGTEIKLRNLFALSAYGCRKSFGPTSGVLLNLHCYFKKSGQRRIFPICL